MKQRRKQEVKAAAADSWHNETETREMKRKNKCCSSVKRFVARGWGDGGVAGSLGNCPWQRLLLLIPSLWHLMWNCFPFSFHFDHLTFCWFLIFLFVNNTIQWRINRIAEQLCLYSLHKHNYVMFIFEHFNAMLIKLEFCFIWETSGSAEVAGEYLIFIVPSAALSAFLWGSLSS